MPTRRAFIGGASSLASLQLLPAGAAAGAASNGDVSMTADLILHHGLVTTLDRTKPQPLPSPSRTGSSSPSARTRR